MGLGRRFCRRLRPAVVSPVSPASVHGRTIQFDTLACADHRLPVKRLMIGEFRNRDMREQSWGGDAARDGSTQRRCLNDTVAAGTSLLAPHRADHLECGINDFQLLGHILTQRLEVATVFRTGLFLRFQHAIFARQVLGQWLVHRFPSRRCRRRFPRLRREQLLQATSCRAGRK